MTWAPYKGGTLLVPSGPSGMHLFTILTSACKDNFHLLVSITSIKKDKSYDDACVFNGGEHPFVNQPSFVFYRLAEQRRSAHLVNGVEKGLFIPKDDMPEPAFSAICDGIDISEFITPWAIKYYHDNKDN